MINLNPYSGSRSPNLPASRLGKVRSAVTDPSAESGIGGFLSGLASSFITPLLGSLFGNDGPKEPPKPPPPPVEYVGFQRPQTVDTSTQPLDMGSRLTAQDTSSRTDALEEFKRRLSNPGAA